MFADGMRVLVTGSSGHLGEALMRCLGAGGDDMVGLDVAPSPYTTLVGSIADRDFVRRSLRGVDAVLHTATLHKPHVGTHTRQAFIDANMSRHAAPARGGRRPAASRFVFTSTTSAFGRALVPPDGGRRPGSPRT